MDFRGLSSLKCAEPRQAITDALSVLQEDGSCRDQVRIWMASERGRILKLVIKEDLKHVLKA